jgi:hypothetical protein
LGKNEVQGEAKYQLLYKTDMGVEEFMTKFHEDNIIDMKVQITLSDGSVHMMHVCEILNATVTNFEIDGEEVITQEEESKKKITKLNDRNSVIKIAI